MNIALLNEALATIPEEHGKHVAKNDEFNKDCIWIDVDDSNDDYCLIQTEDSWKLEMAYVTISPRHDEPDDFDYVQIVDGLKTPKSIADAIIDNYRKMDDKAKEEYEHEKEMNILEDAMLENKKFEDDYADLYGDLN